MNHISMFWAQFAFYVALAMGAIAQAIAYLSGQRNRRRLIGMMCGIGAACLMAFAGKVAAAHLPLMTF